ncbi:unnamed protein product, partial [Meganyctiphanes norvegica]
MKSMYTNLSKNLPSTTLDQGMNIPTRLQVLNGKVSYLPCRVLLYDAKKLNHCLHLRHSIARYPDDTIEQDNHTIPNANLSHTWVAFVGDSKMRDKFTVMVFSLRTDFKWIISWDPLT